MRGAVKLGTGLVLVMMWSLQGETGGATGIGEPERRDNGWQRLIAMTGITMGYSYQQPGSPVVIEGTSATNEFFFADVRLSNVSEKPLSSVTFVAIIEAPEEAQPRIPVEIVRGRSFPASLAPAASIDVEIGLLPVERALEIKDRFGRHTQAVLGIVAVEFADHTRWAAQLKPGATSFGTALATQAAARVRPRLSSRRLSTEITDGDSGALCRDDDGLTYPEGAIAP